jgi:hypothetical protein
MFSSRRPWAVGLYLAAAAALAAPARAADVDKYLPEDTEAVFTLNIKQSLDSALVKKYGLDQARAALQSADMVNDVLKDLGFDPFKDLDNIIVANPGGGDQDRGLIIVHGKFDLKKFQDKADKAVKDETLKVHKVPDGLGGKNLIYEVTVPLPGAGETPLFIALADKDTILASPGKDYVVDGLKKTGAKEKAALKNKAFQTLLEKVDTKQSLSFAMLGSALTKSELPLPDEVKTFLEGLDAVGGGITLDDGIKIQVNFAAKDADAAKEMHKTLDTGLKQALGILAIAAAGNEELTPLVDLLKSVKLAVKEKVITFKAEVSGEIIEKAIKKDQ